MLRATRLGQALAIVFATGSLGAHADDFPYGPRPQDNPTPAAQAAPQPAAEVKATPPAAKPFATQTNPAPQATPARSAQASTQVSTQEVRDDLPLLRPIDLTAQSDDLWQRIRQGFAMPDLINDQVTDRQAYYVSRPEYVVRMADRSRRYLHFIVGELEKRGMPTELALLPMVESAFNPTAQSSAKAMGLWQFVPATGKTYNLSQNWWMDERRDIVASTRAALDYLQTIYEMHGDWHLALASYNWGENAVARAIERNRAAGLPTDYASLNMPNETRYYVPKLQALKNIIAQPQLFGINLPSVPNKPYFAQVKIPPGIDVTVAAKLAETPMDEFTALNPGFNRPVLPGEGQATINVPADKAERFAYNLATHDQPLSSWTKRNLPPGESLESFASRIGVSSAVLRQANGIPAGWRVPTGHALLVPANASATLELSERDLPATRALATPEPRVRYVKVRGKLRAVSYQPAARHAQAVRGPVAGKAHPTRVSAKAQPVRASAKARPAARHATAQRAPTKLARR